MRRSLLACVVLLIFSMIVAAHADLSVVLDLDGDETNGPDTLLVELGDTLSVDVWLTGTDTTYGYGITVSDTVDLLSVVADSTQFVYSSPTGWTDVVVQSSPHAAVLQSTDFGLANQLIPATKAATVRFIVQGSNSLSIDTLQSAWLSTGLETMSFSGFDGAAWISTQSASSNGGGNEDGEVASGELDPTTLSGTFEVPDEDFIYIHGYRQTGTVEFSWSVGNPLFMNGLKVLPGKKAILPTFSDADLERDFSANTHISESVSEAGHTWRDAYYTWYKQCMTLVRTTRAAYQDAWRSSHSREQARQAAQAVVRVTRSTLLDTSEEIDWSNDRMLLPWTHPKHAPSMIWEKRMQEYVPTVSARPHSSLYPKVHNLVASIESTLSSPGPSFVIILESGDRTALVDPSVDAVEFRQRYLSQLELEMYTPGILGRQAVKEVRSRGGIDQ